MTNERHLLTKREALLSSPDARRMGMSFRLVPGARIALTPVPRARQTPTGEPVAVSSGNRSEFGEEFGEGSLEPLTRAAERGSAELTVEASRRSPPAALVSLPTGLVSPPTVLDP
ncbi:MAG: hypothetical protein KME57_18955 [Scytonema hyalinum WJT4-NPBG1]|jgi:protoporphyrinogen oxidase|nr:hypothetical protein [Scytonema hyalinum WJT4-NPBG1]